METSCYKCGLIIPVIIFSYWSLFIIPLIWSSGSMRSNQKHPHPKTLSWVGVKMFVDSGLCLTFCQHYDTQTLQLASGETKAFIRRQYSFPALHSLVFVFLCRGIHQFLHDHCSNLLIRKIYTKSGRSIRKPVKKRTWSTKSPTDYNHMQVILIFLEFTHDVYSRRCMRVTLLFLHKSASSLVEVFLLCPHFSTLFTSVFPVFASVW